MTTDDDIRAVSARRKIDPTHGIDAQIRRVVPEQAPVDQEAEQVEAPRPPGRPQERLRGPDGQFISRPTSPVGHRQSGSVGPPKSLTVDEWIRRVAGH